MKMYIEARECENTEEFEICTISPYGRMCLDSAKQRPDLAVQLIANAMGDMMFSTQTTPCTFKGDVTVTYYDHTAQWECPVCRTMVEDEVHD